MSEQRAKVEKLGAIIRSVAAAGTLRVGFPGAARAAEAYEALRSHGFRKPWLKSWKEWTRSAILDPKVYEVVWPHVEFQCIVAGSIQFFSGSGGRRRSNPNLVALESRLPPILWSIDLGLDYLTFSDALDLDLSASDTHAQTSNSDHGKHDA
jgi:hypothetical protein